ncbi:ribosomal-protein-alanine acetyltransferase [Phenylobacterium sp. Root77]|jgi:ribosomal-protein-alanine N-acetyltransferase|uniref:GNAT family N-acetyltransferase n=1 Tax=unclassified Phenylobacterium TaxID=2640670 RepID=UPI0006FFB7B5|nr:MULTISPECIES: GNAT family N-acetyltransferase [unclassified Phenylobacterium]KQW69100.1 ribosomal-protein-alanine acetyltransferase [Phenylobacterium sp. Root1277]KQW95533.1 ribosomal-protein-alanine acetyltransferase [Phenylobacterium sp. Root1290]KRC41323.1 ribosomal-protein-alanine acetyltransferase [Phenylobacterium sp. Root77]
MKLRGAWSHEADALAQVHAAAFDHAWSAPEIAQLLDGPGGFALLVETDQPLAFILCRAIAGEAEILTLAVTPAARRRGLARALVDAAAGAARMAGAEALFLEVAHDNVPALGLYEATGFSRAGLRRGYYDRGAAGAADAVVMRLDLGRAA